MIQALQPGQGAAATRTALLYRAVPLSSYRPQRIHGRHPAPRWPSNVPYVIDNLWELMRPAGMPSRRFAVYASPTPALALANASAPLAAGDRYVACEVRLASGSGELPIAQLPVDDARRHADRTVLGALIRDRLGGDTCAAPLPHRRSLAPLFLPVLSEAELAALAGEEVVIAELFEAAAAASTFWSTASTEIVPGSVGELFFEIAAGDGYLLQRVD